MMNLVIMRRLDSTDDEGCIGKINRTSRRKMNSLEGVARNDDDDSGDNGAD